MPALEEQNASAMIEAGAKVIHALTQLGIAQLVRKGLKVGTTQESEQWAITKGHCQRAVVNGGDVAVERMHHACCGERWDRDALFRHTLSEQGHTRPALEHSDSDARSGKG